MDENDKKEKKKGKREKRWSKNQDDIDEEIKAEKEIKMGKNDK